MEIVTKRKNLAWPIIWWTLGFSLGYAILRYHIAGHTPWKDLLRWINSRKVLLVAMFMAGAHLFFMGYQGWMTPGKWYWGLPPISLVSFAFFTVGYVINLFGRENPD